MIDTGMGNFYLSPTHLCNSPSFRDGIHTACENSLRFYACQLIQEAGILLKLTQAVMASGQVLLHRFFCKRSFKDFDVTTVAASCVWLAMKLEEETACSRDQKSRLSDVLNVFQRMQSRRERAVPDSPDSSGNMQRRALLLDVERQILVELGFVCHVEHPHKFLLSYLKCLEASPDFIQEAWNLANDSLRTTLCVRFPSNVVACGVIYAAARRLGVPLPQSPPWWLLFDVSLDQILDVCKVLADLYRRIKPTHIELCSCKKLASDKTNDLDKKVDTVEQNGFGNTIPKPLSRLLSSGLSGWLINSMELSGDLAFHGALLGGLLTFFKGVDVIAMGDGEKKQRFFRKKLTEEDQKVTVDNARKRVREKKRDSEEASKRCKTSFVHREVGDINRREHDVGKHRNKRSSHSLALEDRKQKERCSSRHCHQRKIYD